ncbi:related to endoglucanase I precursor [Cephalotrichum gorgonifer]|uniref:Related to endoglucanase I n=1 Tax=Cephalotrichum gorgonifer TaxID=2041049 RepID=A0AAE8SUH1_9PEZI|nr:related to endoglucanase I precursor [Cephalotrichum gorgonifer]
MLKTMLLAALAALPALGQNPVATLCEQYGYHADQGYEVLNNLWGRDAASSGSQCTYYLGRSGSGISWSSEWTWTGAENNVKSYVYAGRQFDRRLVSSISSLPTTLKWSYDVSNIRANVAYDIFTHTDRDHENSNGNYELMIWLHRYGGIWPITTSSTGSPIETVTIGGHNWDLYFGYNGDMQVYSFLPSGDNPINNFSGDVKDYFNYLTRNHQFPETTQYMLIYQVGTEAFTGGPAKFTVSEFSAEVR